MSETSFPFGSHLVNRDGGLLFIFEMANNHQGMLEHGLGIIRAMGEVAKSRKAAGAVKFQFRQLESFLHPGFLHSMMPTSSNKHTKRFIQTRLTTRDYQDLAQAAVDCGLVPFATPFDEESVALCEALEFPVIKIASCSATDWPLLRRVAQSNRPVVCSTAGLSVKDIDEVVAFFRSRRVPLAIMHCVGIYPTPRERLQLDLIRVLRARYPDIVIGYSGHETATDLDVPGMAIAAGASILERHVGLPTAEITLNGYSLDPAQVDAWVGAAVSAHSAIAAGQNRIQTDAEQTSMNELKRGVFCRVAKKSGEFLQEEDLMLAMPCLPGQFSAGDWDDVIGMPVPHTGIAAMMPVMKLAGGTVPGEISVSSIVEQVKQMLTQAKIALPEQTPAEISHPYGLDTFGRHGAVIIDVVNREYCKKLILQLPGQNHPIHKHIQKEETFQILMGEVEAVVDDRIEMLKPGDSLVIHRGAMHGFRTDTGMIMEEISTTHVKGDSVYQDQGIPSDPTTRKTPVCL
jgi:sialic acid synthase SpsE/quercetin dioxygenase-like cupin family protein